MQEVLKALTPEALSVDRAKRLLNDFFTLVTTASENRGTGRSMAEQVTPFINSRTLEFRLSLMTLYTNGGSFPQDLLPKLDAYFNGLVKRIENIVAAGTYYESPGYIPLNQREVWNELSQALGSQEDLKS